MQNISFLLLILVAFIHGYNENLRFSDQGNVSVPVWLSFLERFISDGICRIAVPLFFAISGYLACESTGRTLSAASYFILLKKRIFSLLIPYLLVSAAGIALVMLLQLFPFSRPFFNNYSISKTSFSEWIRVWLLNPVPFQLWFIRFLMNYFLFFPVLFFAIRYLRELFVFILFLFWSWTTLYYKIGAWKIAFSLCTFLFCLVGGSDFQPYIPTQKNELEGLFFFGLGMYASLHRMPMVLPKGKKLLPVLVIFWIFWIAYRTLISLEIPPRHNEVHYHLIGLTLVGMVLVWYCYDVFSGSIDSWNWLRKNAGLAFGVFLFHEPVLTILKKGMIRLGGGSDVALLVSFILAPVLSFLFSLLFARFISEKYPGAYKIITGNRKPRAVAESS